MTLDIRTLGVVSAITPLVLGLIMLIYVKERKVYGGFGHWILANFGLSFGYALNSLRGILPAVLSVLIGNLFILYSIILIYEGIERFYGRPGINRFNYLLFASYALLQTYFLYFDPSVRARVILSSFAVVLLLLLVGRRLFLVSIPALTRTSQSAGYIFFVSALFPCTWMLSALFRRGPVDFLSDYLNPWLSVLFIIFIVTWTFYFFFLNSARLELDLETARAELELIAQTDPLTNLYNRRYFDEQAELEFQRAKRSGFKSSILLLDIDGFKSINDVNGHEVGDSVLLTLAAVLRSELRSFDLIARYGGDEFMIMLTNTNRDQAYSIADRIRRRIALTPFVVNGRIFNVTLSAGIATLDSADQDLRLLLRRGDDALYRAKEQGKNCVIAV